MRILAIAALLASLAPGVAGATSWYRVAGNEKTTLYVDLDSLTRNGGVLTGRSMSVYAELIDDEVRAGEIKTEYHCDEGYFRTLTYTYYGDDHQSLGTEPSATIDEHKVPAPNSLNEAMLTFVCKGTGGTRVDDPFADALQEFAGY